MLDFSDLITERTKHFVGREWVFRAINNWLVEAKGRHHLLEGKPGTGKTAIAARLVQASQGTVALDGFTELTSDFVAYHHFCQAYDDTTLNPLRFVENLSRALANRYEPFAKVLLEIDRREINITTSIQTGSVEAGGTVTGPKIEKLVIRNLSPRVAFDEVVRRPLQKLEQKGFAPRILILVDSLDEALTWGENNITDLLGEIMNPKNPLTDSVRFLLTSRDDKRVEHAVGKASLDLIADAPDSEKEVRAYAMQRLRKLPESQSQVAGDKIATASKGNFLYARYVLEDLLEHPEKLDDIETLDLPEDLQGIYSDFLKRELAKNLDDWDDDYAPLLGALAVAQGVGLTFEQLVGITDRKRSRVRRIVRTCSQYLTGPFPEGPLRIYHQSFRDFLLDAKGDYVIEPGETHKTIAEFFIDNCSGCWADYGDGCDNDPNGCLDYGLRFTVTHLARAIDASTGKKRQKLTVQLVGLVTKQDFKSAHLGCLGEDWNALLADLVTTLAGTVAGHPPESLPLILRSALDLVAFEDDYLDPAKVFELAKQGDIDAAERRQLLFRCESEWRQAALLAIAWVAAPDKQDTAAKQARLAQAVALRNRVVQRAGKHLMFKLLLERLDAVLGLAEPPHIKPLAVPLLSDYEARSIMTNPGSSDAEGMYPTVGSEKMEIADDERVLYQAEEDAPRLLRYAIEHPEEGTDIFDRYVALQSSNEYLDYRNETLMRVLDAALQHPDPNWVRNRLPGIMSGALSLNTSYFTEGVGIAVLAMQAASDIGTARTDLKKYWQWAEKQANALRDKRGLADSRGDHRRRLAALAECYAVLPLPLENKQNRLADLLRFALWLPRGYAGYMSPTGLTLAETIRICKLENKASDKYQTPEEQAKCDTTTLLQFALCEARGAAHNLQDSTLCARTTARYNAMRAHWWQPGGFGAEPTIKHLLKTPESERFAARHILGEDYNMRLPVPLQPALSPRVKDANSLPELAEAYRRPYQDFQHLNDELPLEAAVIDGGRHITMLRVPDAKFRPLLAARFAAELMVEEGLSVSKRVRLLQSLAPIAVANPTALDTVLMRLLLAAYPLLDDDALEALAKIAPAFPSFPHRRRNQP